CYHATTKILAALEEHDHAIHNQFNQPTPPTQTAVPPPSEEDELESRKGRRKATQQFTPAPSVPRPHLPRQQFPQHLYQYPGYIVYLIPPPHTSATGTSSSTVLAPPFPSHFPYPYPYPAY
ncbi:hypothetical protein PIB30_062990, partial [Stylosanthes scabra]|nr:hypothetical protein [Stylosanthes scabra]